MSSKGRVHTHSINFTKEAKNQIAQTKFLDKRAVSQRLEDDSRHNTEGKEPEELAE